MAPRSILRRDGKGDGNAIAIAVLILFIIFGTFFAYCLYRILRWRRRRAHRHRQMAQGKALALGSLRQHKPIERSKPKAANRWIETYASDNGGSSPASTIWPAGRASPYGLDRGYTSHNLQDNWPRLPARAYSPAFIGYSEGGVAGARAVLGKQKNLKATDSPSSRLRSSPGEAPSRQPQWLDPAVRENRRAGWYFGGDTVGTGSQRGMDTPRSQAEQESDIWAMYYRSSLDGGRF